MKQAGTKGTGGFSLIEVVVAITILGLVTAPICGSLVLSHRLNARSEELMQARLAVTNAVETLMAEGITQASNDYRSDDPAFDGVTVKTVANGDCYTVTVTSDTVNSVTVETQIRAGSGGGST